jgi:predicted phosphodiesterase
VSGFRLVALGLSVAVVASVYFLFFYEAPGHQPERVVWWIASDPHFDEPEDPHLLIPIQDVNELGIADYAVLLGDLLFDSPRYAQDFLDAMSTLDVKRWYYVLGNHDYDRNTEENVLPLFYGSVEMLGIRFIFISDERGWEDGQWVFDGVMGEEQSEWFWRELLEHQEQPKFIFSHQPFDQWNIWGDLADALGSLNIRAWFSGHLHRWQVDDNFEPYGFAYVCDSSLDWKGNYHGVFLFMERRGDTVEVTIRFRDHLNREWISVETMDGAIVENISFTVHL